MIPTLISRFLGLAAASLALLFGCVGLAQANAVSVSYYTLSTGHPDAEHDVDGTVLGLINSLLGPNGLPVVSALSLGSPAGSSAHLNDRDPITGELLWWTPHTGVTQSFFYPAVEALPFSITSDFFPNGAGSDGNGYLSAHMQGTFSTPAGGTITLNLGADDDAWVFIDGVLAVDLGGVHVLSTAPTTISALSAGSHTLDLFFADRHMVQSGLSFSADLVLNPLPLRAVPEPATLALFGIGLVVLGFSRRKQ